MTELTTQTIIALDLSMNCTGYAVVSIDGSKVQLIKKGIIKAKGRESHGKRLKRQYNTLKVLSEQYPDAIIVKESVHSGRAKTSIVLAKVHGVVELLFNEGTIYKYPATTIKKQITGNGKAKKEEVMTAVIECLVQHGIVDVTFKTDDESDAVAVALTFLLKKGWL